MSLKRVLITGSNRGIGLEYVRQYLEDGWRVYATCRLPSEAQALHRLTDIYRELSIHHLDITVPEDITAIGHELQGVPLDLLINNAAVYFKENGNSLANLHYDLWRRTLEVNTIGTTRITASLLPNLEHNGRTGLVVVMSSHMGSIADIDRDDSYYYRSSKAALNAAMQCLAAALRERNVGVLLLHPGGVATRMGPADGIAVRDSVAGMRDLIGSFSLEQSGRFFRYDGTEMPW